MDAVLTWIRLHIMSWLTPPKQIEIMDIIQIIVIAFFVYRLILWLKNSRAYTLLRGILLIGAFVLVANILNMDAIIWILGNIGVVALTAVVIVFQPELRKFLEQMGRKKWFNSLFSLGVRSDEDRIRFSDQTINELVRACFDMGDVKTGALIVLEQDVVLTEFEHTGIPVDGILSGSLLINIFEKNTPLHDGAVIVRGNRVAAATCYLPLTDNMELSKSLGTRHRAALGISEISDSFTIVVSEETGKVSYAVDGSLTAGVSPAELREQLYSIQHPFETRHRWKRKENKQRG
ncbi:MAG: diadenylate cyclase CdaA [Lachnospiraceae bacterium]|nr:diadenylate cyclase CdaA [Lachnospiraceae bacterium]